MVNKSEKNRCSVFDRYEIRAAISVSQCVRPIKFVVNVTARLTVTTIQSK